MKTLPPCDHDECPPTGCRQNADAKGVGISDFLADVLRYRRGLGRYDFSRLPDDERSIAALEAWEDLETRIENALSKAGVKVS